VKYRYFNILLFSIYVAFMTAVMIWQGVGISPDRYAFILLLPSFFIKRARAFLFDWLPFLFILLSYDFLRGFADNLGKKTHYLEPVQIDYLLFNYLPTIKLQAILYNPNHTSILDYLSTLTYLLHFALPLIFGYLLWNINKIYFRKFTTGLLILSYGGWITYIFYPAAPPWLASKLNYIPQVEKILNRTLQSFPDNLHLPTIYQSFNPNEVAAIPSMHAAYPTLIFLFGFLFFKWRALYFLPYVLFTWFSIVYLGEHYVIDVIMGIFYALISLFVANGMLHNVKFQKSVAGLLKIVCKQIYG
jgi:hypothetical protein